MTIEELFEEIEKAKAARPEWMKAIELFDEATKVYLEAMELMEACRPRYRVTTSNRTVKIKSL